ncbi:uncharacterized protein TRUGW13939_10983 [Talaromyces rugulosus]|uniref:Altered inheritance of mitochondria protein 11 n=1 Tax=Talaromyces rugulosus TaxID=121627 RepID=A0A7H8RBK7_TALRU|nr:uncharacterized protein TRUGW13939_10983 [Talaromyces rugulosus]QKX63812.1 hypothetical protein TRUGW13939_10983 [Talaromyces rugulosus]
MSWVVKRWLGSPEEEAASSSPAPVPSTSTQPTNTNTFQSSQTPSLQQKSQVQQQQEQQQPPRTFPNSQKILISGLFFLSIASVVTRRALARRRLHAIPPFYSSSVYHQPPGNGALDAAEAFNIATINVASVGMTALGGAMCALGIDNIEQARVKVRTGMGIAEGVPPTAEEEKQFEQDIEDWVGKMLDKKDIGEIKKKVEAARSEAGKKE